MSQLSLIRSCIVIAGPTAIGKTAVAVQIASKSPCLFEIVSADSIQIYQKFDRGSAKPTVEERAAVPFHMVDIANPDQDFTVVDFVDLAVKAIADIVERGRVPLIVGGAGLYIRSLTQGFGIPSAGPNEEYRNELTFAAAERGSPALHAELAAIDPESANRLHPNDLKRIIRALEVFKLTGKSLSYWHHEDQKRERATPMAYFAFDRDRNALYRQIDLRVKSMYESGLVDEVRSLRAQGYSPDLKPMTSVGYLQANQVVDGRIDENQAIILTENATHQYARRQLIWFRREPVTDWIDVEGLTADDIAAQLLRHPSMSMRSL